MSDIEQLPPRVRAAFAFVNFALHVTRPCDAEVTPRPLNEGEKAVEAAALEVLRNYLNGEMSYAPEPAVSHATPTGRSSDAPEVPDAAE